MPKFRIEVKIHGTVEMEMPDIEAANNLQFYAGSAEILNDPTFAVDYYTAGDAVPVEEKPQIELLPLQNLEMKMGGMPEEPTTPIDPNHIIWPKDDKWTTVDDVDHTELPDYD